MGTGRAGTALCVPVTVWLLLCLVLVAEAYAKPELRIALVRRARSPRVVGDWWSVFSYEVANPDPQPANVRLTLRAADNENSVFEKELTVGPEAVLRGRTVVTAAQTEMYTAALYHQGQRVAFTDVPARYSISQTNTRMLLLDDDANSSGTFGLNRRMDLIARVEAATSGVADAPDSWAAYDRTAVVAVARANLQDMNALQFEALLRYVRRGGTLVFVSPAGAMAAAQTPLSDLLPVAPLRVRHIEELPELDAWGERYYHNQSGKDRKNKQKRVVLADPEGFPFLESAPLGDGVTTLSTAGFPICRWRRCGLGYVGVVAVEPFAELMQRSGCLGALSDHILSWGQPPFGLSHPLNSLNLPKVNRLLTGFAIPKARSISKVLGGYVLAITILLALGFARKRHAVGWGAAALTGLLFTAGIFRTATLRNAHRPARTASIIDLRTVTPKQTSGQTLVSLFAKTDCRPTLAHTRADGRFRALPAPPRRYRRGVTVQPPLVLRETGDTGTAPDLAVRALQPRSVAAAYSLPAASLPALPLVRLRDDAPELDEWQLPPWAPDHTDAFALFRNDQLPMRIDERRCAMKTTGGRLMELNPVSLALRDHLSTGLFPAPCLVLMHPWIAERDSLPLDLADFRQQGAAVRLLPLQVQAEPGPLFLPAAMIRIDPATQMANLLRHAGQWSGAKMRAQAEPIHLHAVLPPFLMDLDITRVHVRLDASNPGENVDFDVALAPGMGTRSTAGYVADSRTVRATRVGLPDFHFDDLGAAPLADPVTGRFSVLLWTRRRSEVLDPISSERANSWYLNSLRIELEGALPADAPTRRF